MSVPGLYRAYQKWRETPSVEAFIGLYRNGFEDACRWSPPRRLIRVVFNLATGKYERFYQYWKKDGRWKT